MAQVTLGKPTNTTLEIAGPERFSLSELASRYLQKTGDARTVKADEQARYFGAILQTKTLIPGNDARLGKITFETWFANRQPKPVTA